MDPKERFQNACRRLPVDRPPVWMMRQAGRYLPEYRALRARHSTLALMKTPELAAEITLQPVKRLGVDAAIIYSDILMVPEAMGLRLEFVEGEGPRLTPPVRTEGALRSLQTQWVTERLQFIAEAIRRVKGELDSLPLLGFAGAPFTVATYMVEGGGSDNFSHVRKMIRTKGELFRALLEKVTEATIASLLVQQVAGAEALQLFDSWGGILDADEYEEWSLPYTRKVFQALGGKIPTILFVKGGTSLLELMVATGASVLGVSHETPLGLARQKTGGEVALQGNLDPLVLLHPVAEIEGAVEKMVAEWGRGAGYIMNLGHGVLPSTPVDHAVAFVEACKKFGSRI